MKVIELVKEEKNISMQLSKVSRPIIKMKVKWNGYDCIIQKLRYKDKLAKLKPDYSGNPMPYDYFWVDFVEIGF